MKKLIALLLVLVMVLSLVACGAKTKKITLRMIDTLASETRTASIQKIIDDKNDKWKGEYYFADANHDGKIDSKDVDAVKDIIFFDDAIPATVSAMPGEQIVFEPDTAHAPLIGNGTIRKAIFKIKVSE